VRDEELGAVLKDLWKKNYSVYGRRKLTKAAKRRGLDCGRDQVERLMKRQGIRGASRAKRRFTTHADSAHQRAPDLVSRAFVATRPDQLWVCDFTYCSTWSGVVYVAFIIDVFSRRLVGWKASRSMTASLVVDALNMAAWTRHTSLDGLICHTDAGSQGEFNRLSQHLMNQEVLGGSSTTRSRSGNATTDEVARSSTAPTRSRATVLDRDCQGRHPRRGGDLRRIVPAGRAALVP
jgi:putative transposase